jgi:hypothetical protein
MLPAILYGESMTKKSTHVVPNPDGGWSVKRGGALRAYKRFDKKQDAISYGRNMSRNEGADFVIHRKDGTIITIISKESYSHDPAPPRDRDAHK